jgi:hypothetical protein
MRSGTWRRTFFIQRAFIFAQPRVRTAAFGLGIGLGAYIELTSTTEIDAIPTRRERRTKSKEQGGAEAGAGAVEPPWRWRWRRQAQRQARRHARRQGQCGGGGGRCGGRGEGRRGCAAATLPKSILSHVWFGHSTYSCVGVGGFLATKHPKKQQNGYLLHPSSRPATGFELHPFASFPHPFLRGAGMGLSNTFSCWISYFAAATYPPDALARQIACIRCRTGRRPRHWISNGREIILPIIGAWPS